MIFSALYEITAWMHFLIFQIFSNLSRSLQSSKAVCEILEFLFSSPSNFCIFISTFEKRNWRLRKINRVFRIKLKRTLSNYRHEFFFHPAWRKHRDFPRIKWHLSRLPLSRFPFVIFLKRISLRHESRGSNLLESFIQVWLPVIFVYPSCRLSVREIPDKISREIYQFISHLIYGSTRKWYLYFMTQNRNC